jgi:hypothetical protein
LACLRHAHKDHNGLASTPLADVGSIGKLAEEQYFAIRRTKGGKHGYAMALAMGVIAIMY